jgi:hypothetical protein
MGETDMDYHSIEISKSTNHEWKRFAICSTNKEKSHDTQTNFQGIDNTHFIFVTGRLRHQADGFTFPSHGSLTDPNPNSPHTY